MRLKQCGVKLIDIARSSGVSVATVSLVLNNKPGVSEATRSMVLDTANTLGYTPKQAKSGKVRQDLQSLGLIIRAEPNDTDKGRSNVFYSPIISGIENACRDKHITLMLTSVLVDNCNMPVELPRLLLENQAEGYLLVGIQINTFLDNALQNIPAPAILVDGYSNYHPYNSINTANFEGAYASVEYLIKRGHRNIGFVGGWDGYYPSFHERREGYRRCLADNGMTNLHYADSTTIREDIFKATQALITANKEITALIGVNDVVAINAINALLDLGVRVPEDVSVIGFDDIVAAETMNPPLTTMQIDKTSMGQLAVELLTFQKQKPETNPVSIWLHPVLIERNSVRSLDATR
jgi:LacI family transcriptional regulator